MTSDTMNLFEPGRFTLEAKEGRLAGSSRRYTKTLGQLAGLYEDQAAHAAALASMNDAVVYEVTEFRPSTKQGDLVFGVTRMAPGKIGREFFMTRGHIHAKVDRSEIYYGNRGRGLMLMESPAGETRIVEIAPQTICYVPPCWIHRAVNVGSKDFVMMFCYPADAGQDYTIIERAGGMRSRIVDDGKGNWAEASNEAYVARPSDEIARIAEACCADVDE